MRALVALSLVFVGALASANPILRTVAPTFYQSGNSNVIAGLLVEASTDLPVLVVSGGFTISCSTSPLQHTAERLLTFTGFFGPWAVVPIPPVLPSTYAIPGWSSIPAGSCGGQCVMRYKGEARDETSLEIRVGGTGVGANFTLIPAGEQRLGDSRLINICRSGQPQCCTRGCQLP
jgi:hypothetical protein